VRLDRGDSFEGLAMGAPSRDDAASRATFRVHDGGGEHVPHRAAGAKDGALPRLNDGEVAQDDDDTARSVWYDSEGRFSVDLGKPLRVDRVDTYSWHRHERAPQWFSLWGSPADEMPDPEFAHGGHGRWTLLGVVDSRPLGQGGHHGSEVTGRGGAPLGTFRHLLWIAEDMGNGTFFTEIDVHAAR
jgi:hypothetical protein